MASTFKMSNGDVRISAMSGRPTLVSGLQKTRQDVHEMLTIDTLPNGFGAGIISSVGVTAPSPQILVNLTKMRISRAIDNLRTIRLARRHVHGPDEIVVKVEQLHVAPAFGNPKEIEFSVRLRTAAGDVAGVSGKVEG